MRKTHIQFKILPLTVLQHSVSLLLFEAVYLGGLTASKRRHSFIFKPAEEHRWLLTAFLSLPINSEKTAGFISVGQWRQVAVCSNLSPKIKATVSGSI